MVSRRRAGGLLSMCVGITGQLNMERDRERERERDHWGQHGGLLFLDLYHWVRLPNLPRPRGLSGGESRVVYLAGLTCRRGRVLT